MVTIKTLLFCTLAAGCMVPDALSKDEGLPSERPADSREAGAKADASTPSSTARAREPDEGDSQEESVSGEAGPRVATEIDASGPATSANPVETDAGPTSPTPGDDSSRVAAAARIKGSLPRSDCLISTRPREGSCGGLYCGVGEADLLAALDNPVCAASEEEYRTEVCTGKFSDAMYTCMFEAVLNDPLVTGRELVTPLRACVGRARSEYGRFSDACYRCFADIKECVVAECVVPCAVNSRSKDCESCVGSNCLENVLTCLRMPNPY